MATEDYRLERLYDYTKFHLGIYIVAASSMITIAGAEHNSSFLSDLIKHSWLLFAAIVSMVVAGAAGGVIVSSCAVGKTFDDVWGKSIGPWGLRLWRGSKWATVEHLAFWCSGLLFAAAALWPK